jgi:two-component system, sensor histidine kinase and response regulator
LLENENLVVTVANNGKEGTKAVNRDEYDCVLMDIQMPIMGGYEATSEIRKSKKFKELPVIAMTAHAMAGEREKCIDAGMNDYVTKPIDPDKLFGTLVKWIEPGKRDFTTVVKESAVVTAEEDNLIPESIQGIDVVNGLTRVAGNKKLYRKLLLSFKANNVDSTHAIRKSLDSDDMEDAERLVHTIKGVAGNIGANDLFTSAAAMEAALRYSDEEQYERLLEAFAEELDFVMKSIDNSLQTGKTVKEAVIKDQPLDVENATTLLSEVMELMEDDYGETENRLELLKAMFDSSEFKTEFGILTSQIDGYDFDSAMETIKELSRTIEDHGKKQKV